jgi:endonuclease-3
MALKLSKLIQKLKKFYGDPTPPKASDPFELILRENIAYLVDDARRERALEHLRKTVGLRPAEILNASPAQIDQATELGGVAPQYRSVRIRESALIALTEFGGDLSAACKLPPPKAIKALKEFPGIGEPGAEKILLFTKNYPVLALDSNGLRVLLRIGFGEEKKNYSATYKSVREAVSDQTGRDFKFLIEAHQLLRQHGKTLCKTNKPRCEECPVSSLCVYFLQRH